MFKNDLYCIYSIYITRKLSEVWGVIPYQLRYLLRRLWFSLPVGYLRHTLYNPRMLSLLVRSLPHRPSLKNIILVSLVGYAPSCVTKVPRPTNSGCTSVFVLICILSAP